ncbi:hypothetical protein B0J17DRAFT_770934 [Rhizoctonia solani]|nr:hypothetical protein B0J17DRAFT_770934 [Rhizoctonia solani]
MSKKALPNPNQTDHARSPNQHVLIDSDTCATVDYITNDMFNAVSSTAPKLSVNGLPTEILVLIFEFVLEMRMCPATPDFEDYSLSVPKQPIAMFLSEPVIFSHVCLRWRRTALHAPQLWTHIDLQHELYRSGYPNATIRRDTFIKRADQRLLDVHVLHQPSATDPQGFDSMQTEENSYQLIGMIAPRTQRLTIDTTSRLDDAEYPREILTAFLAKCIPGVLTALTFNLLGTSPIYDAGAPFTAEREPLYIPEDKLESLFGPITALSLKRYYPKAGSKAYQGLVDLRLLGTIPIAESALVGILESNPRLRVLHISFEITDSLPDDYAITPIRLFDLEIVKLGACLRRQTGTLLRWLNPGTTPLRLSMFNPYPIEYPYPDFHTKGRVQEFLARSKVTKLGFHTLDSYFHLTELLKIAPDVQVLVVDGIRCGMTDEEYADNGPQHPLDSLCIVRSVVNPPDLQTVQRLIKKHHVQKLTFSSRTVQSYSKRAKLEVQTMLNTLYTLCPIVEIIPEGESSPMKDWY